VSFLSNSVSLLTYLISAKVVIGIGSVILSSMTSNISLNKYLSTFYLADIIRCLTIFCPEFSLHRFSGHVLSLIFVLCLDCYFVCLVLLQGIESRTLHVLDKYCTTKLHPQPLFIYFYFFEAESHSVTQAGLELKILLLPPECWDFMPSCVYIILKNYY
jgi:hypothetical protein